MKTQTLLLATHAGAAVLGAAALLLGTHVSPVIWVAPAAAGLVGVVVWLLTWRLAAAFRRQLRGVVQAVAKAEQGTAPPRGLAELEQAGRDMCEAAQRWAQAATVSRHHTQELHELATLFDRRHEARSDGSFGSQIRLMLSGMAENIDADLGELVNGVDELSHCLQEIAGGAEQQGDAVTKTTTYVEQLSANIDTVEANAGNAEAAVKSMHTAAGTSMDMIDTLSQGMRRIRAHAEANERKLRFLSDRSRELTSIIETISSNAARTDLLALNASLESVRAGEHGRGFAIVADEVHQLAEQAAQSTRDATALLESAQLETQESIAVVLKELAAVDEELQQLESAHSSLEALREAAGESTNRVAEISQAAQHQFKLTQDVVLAVERIAGVTKSTRSSAEKGCWTTKSLTKAAEQFDATLVPLRNCSQRGEWAERRVATAAAE